MKLAVSNSRNSKNLYAAHRSHDGNRTGVRRAGYSRMEYKDLDHVLKVMKRLYNEYKADPRIRQKAHEITSGIAKDPRTGLANRRNYQAMAEAIYQWMKGNIAYQRDPAGVEYLQSPIKTLKYGFGDCDDLTTLGAALMSAVGIPVRFGLAKTNAQNPRAYSHIYAEYEADGQWKPFDPALHTQAGVGLSDSTSFGTTSVSLDDAGCGCGCGGAKKQDLGAVGTITAILQSISAAAGTAKGLGVEVNDIENLLGLNSREKKRRKRDAYKQALIKAGVNSNKLGNWHSDEWKAGKDFDKIIQRGGNLGVQFLNEKMTANQQIDKGYTQNLLRQLGPYLKKHKQSTTSSIGAALSKFPMWGYTIAAASIIGPTGYYAYKKYLNK